jgi:hypothetical protein
VKRITAVVLAAVLVAACGGEPVAQPEPTPVPTPAPVPAPPPEPEPEPEPVELTGTLTTDGDTVTALGTSNLPDGAVLVWELAETVESMGENPDLVLRDADGEVPSGEVTVLGGAFRIDVTGEGWGALGLCEALPLELFVAFMPWRALAELDALPDQPESLYALYGERGERIPGAMPPAELRTLSGGEVRVVVELTCP